MAHATWVGKQIQGGTSEGISTVACQWIALWEQNQQHGQEQVFNVKTRPLLEEVPEPPTGRGWSRICTSQGSKTTHSLVLIFFSTDLLPDGRRRRQSMGWTEPQSSLPAFCFSSSWWPGNPGNLLGRRWHSTECQGWMLTEDGCSSRLNREGWVCSTNVIYELSIRVASTTPMLEL